MERLMREDQNHLVIIDYLLENRKRQAEGQTPERSLAGSIETAREAFQNVHSENSGYSHIPDGVISNFHTPGNSVIHTAENILPSLHHQEHQTTEQITREPRVSCCQTNYCKSKQNEAMKCEFIDDTTDQENILQKAKRDAPFPVYSGKPGEYYDWVEKAWQVIRFKELSDHQAGEIARISLVGRALKEAICRDPQCHWGFKRLAAEMKMEFECLDSSTAIACLFRMTPGVGESLDDLMRRLEETYDRVFPETISRPTDRDRALNGIALSIIPHDICLRLPAEATDMTFAQFRRKIVREEQFMYAYYTN
jgi:hypothetical protein